MMRADRIRGSLVPKGRGLSRRRRLGRKLSGQFQSFFGMQDVVVEMGEQLHGKCLDIYAQPQVA